MCGDVSENYPSLMNMFEILGPVKIIWWGIGSENRCGRSGSMAQLEGSRRVISPNPAFLWVFFVWLIWFECRRAADRGVIEEIVNHRLWGTRRSGVASRGFAEG